MLHARTALLALAVALAVPLGITAVIPVASAQAAEVARFTPAAFEAAQQAGSSILVEVTAPWCPTCKAQKPILSELTAQPQFADLVILEVDFDSQKDALRMLGVRMQSTLISYKGDEEVGRSVGVTDKAAIADQLAKSI